MMSIRSVKGANRDYLLSDDAEQKKISDYYGNGAEREAAEWYGKGAEAEGKTGEVSAQDFKAMLDSQEAAGRKIYGFDATFSSDKSISVAMAQDAETRADLLAAEKAAVKRALDYMVEKGYLQAQKRQGGEIVHIPSNQLNAALFHHDTARPSDANGGEPDLQSHIHAFIKNEIRLEDGSTASLYSHDLYTHQNEIGLVFRQAEAEELHKRGYETEMRAGKEGEQGFFQLKGFTDELREANSGRSRDMDAYREEHGLDNSAASNQAANLATRHNKKKDFRLSDKILEVREQMAAAGWHVEKQAAPIVPTAEEKQAALSRALEKMGREEYAFSAEEIRAATVAAGVSAEVRADEVQGLLDQSAEAVELTGKDGGTAYTTKTNQRTEAEIVDMWQRGRGRGFAIDSATAEQELDRLTSVDGVELAEEQKRMCYHLLCTKDDVLITNGFAGTGKTFAAKYVKEVAEAQGYEVTGAAYTGKAADGLKDKGIDARTMDSVLLQAERESLKNQGLEPEQVDFATKSTYNLDGIKQETGRQRTLVLLDEAGMVSDSKMHEFLRLAKLKNWKVALMGDYKQHPPIGAGAPMRMLCEQGAATCYLSDIRRQEAEEDRAAVREFVKEDGDIGKSFQIWRDKGYIHEVEEKDERAAQVVEDWEKSGQTVEGRLILTNTNARRKMYNAQILKKLQERGELTGRGLEVNIEAPTDRNPDHTERRTVEPKQRIIFTRNSSAQRDGLDVRNGTFATVESIEGTRITAKTDGGQVVTWDANQYAAFDHAYATTNVKSQGMSIKDVFCDMDSREQGTTHATMYVAGSRHKASFHLYTDSAEKLQEVTAKECRKATSNDYINQFEEGNRATATGYQNRIARARAIAQKMKTAPKVLASRLPRQGVARLGNIASFARGAAGRGQNIAGTMFDMLDDEKKGTDIMKQGVKRVLSVAKAPVQIAADIIKNPLTGILKAPLTAAGAAMDAAQGATEITMGAAKTASQTGDKKPKKAEGVTFKPKKQRQRIRTKEKAPAPQR